MKHQATGGIILYFLTALIPLSAPRVYCQSHLDIQTVPMLTITDNIGVPIEVQFATNLLQPNAWITLTNFTLASSPFYFVDTSATGSVARFYRTALENPESGKSGLDTRGFVLVW